MRPTLLSAFAAAAMLSAQSPVPAQRGPAFDVASIRLNTSGSASSSSEQRPNGSFQARNMSLKALVSNAYDVPPRQILGGPEWVESDRFDVVARAPEGPEAPDVSMMLRALLADRFKLVTHTESREQPVYALVLARSDGRLGAQIEPSKRDCSAPGPRPCGVNMTGDGRGATMQAQAVSLAELAGSLTNVVDRAVLDRTGIAGAFDVQLRFTRDGVAGGVAGDAPSIFSALQEQLGLKLESGRGPVDVLIIDTVERPTPD